MIEMYLNYQAKDRIRETMKIQEINQEQVLVK
jgi:hypothetical protein